ncbi:MAG TPA: bifunctional (p)ppGpp synthetase/guanosine-3',5'-bis(diphosphate) 3'-pyrophosphohydrolase [Acidimicrobiia bacterium]
MPLSDTTETNSPVELTDVLRAFRAHHPEGDGDLLERAYQTAEQAHRGQFRKTGHPYITHPLAVAYMLAGYGLDGTTIAAALLHDTVEDTEVTMDQIRDDFGEDVARLIDGVTKLDRVRFSNREQAQAATIRKMVVAMAQDVRVLIIKLFDRLHNLRTVHALRDEKQARVARETLDVYAPLAHRLGVQQIKHEFEDRCFAILYPGPNAEIQARLAEAAPEREAFIEKMITEISGMLIDAGIEAEVTGRPKHQYSIYRKMMEQNRPFEDIHDLIGIRVVTTSTRDCYAALGLVHSHWVPVTGRFKDFIAMPKINLYQSLHTTVIGPDGKPIEVQIRTQEMHNRAEAGIAAHWRYKEGDVSSHIASMEVDSLDEDPEEFLANLKLDLYRDEVFILTPGGDVKELPRGSTPVDFAYTVHTEVGHRCVGARVNGRLVPLSTRLESGDIVEVLTSKSPDAGPSRDWLTFVRTGRAKSKIRQWFQKERRDQAVSEGKEMVQSLFKREAPDLSATEREAHLDAIAVELGLNDAETLVAALGDGNVSLDSLHIRLQRRLSPDTGDILFRPPRRRRPSEAAQVVVEGQDDMLVQMARCCSPVPGDPIVGYVTVGRGVSVHRADCTNVSSLSGRRERTVEVSWPGGGAGAFVVWIQVEALDRTRLLRDVTQVVSDTGANITASSTTVGEGRVAVLKYEVELSDPGQLARLLADIRGVDGVFAAFRLANDPSAM